MKRETGLYNQTDLHITMVYLHIYMVQTLNNVDFFVVFFFLLILVLPVFGLHFMPMGELDGFGQGQG